MPSGARKRKLGANVSNMTGYQKERSETEKKLPDYIRKMLDMARGGYDVFGKQITAEKAKAILAAYLPDEH